MNYNRPETWIDPQLHKEPAFDKESYQRRVDAICGLNEFGRPNVLLTWMPSRENYSRRYCEWDKAGFGIKTELRCQYVYDTLSDGRGNELEIPPPRWGFKQFMPPAQYASTDERTRWQRADQGSQVFVREARPPRPADGFYIPCLKPLAVIARHNGYCCRRAKKDRTPCVGYYRVPDESYLVLLKKAVENREKENAERPDAGFTPKLLRQAALEAAAEIKERERRADASMDELITHNLPSMLAYYTGDKDFLRRADFRSPE